MKKLRFVLIFAAILSAVVITGCIDNLTPAFTDVDNIGAATADEFIDKNAVKNIVFAHAGIDPDDVYGYEIELEREGRYVKYEVDFKCNGYEYEYDVNAVDGSIVFSDKEIDR